MSGIQPWSHPSYLCKSSAMNYTPRSTNTLWKFNFFNKNICVYVGCMHVCVVSMHMCTQVTTCIYRHMHMNVEVRGRHQVLFSATSPPCVLSQGLSVNLEVPESPRDLPGSIPSHWDCRCGPHPDGGGGWLNSGPHAYPACTFPREPRPPVPNKRILSVECSAYIIWAEVSEG